MVFRHTNLITIAFFLISNHGHQFLLGPTDSVFNNNQVWLYEVLNVWNFVFYTVFLLVENNLRELTVSFNILNLYIWQETNALMFQQDR
jgi:hypothetical protein